MPVFMLLCCAFGRMEPLQIGVVVLASVFGVAVLVTYLAIIDYAKSAETRSEVWAALNFYPLFYVWCVTATCAALGFLLFVGAYARMDPPSRCAGEPDVYFDTLWVPLASFLFFSALYAPLLIAGLRDMVIFVLAGAAASSVVMAWYASSIFGASHVATVFAILLAVHCSVMDLVIWGTSWYYWSPLSH